MDEVLRWAPLLKVKLQMAYGDDLSEHTDRSLRTPEMHSFKD